jgi:BCD family chlorophyll transporter-like MFS transporter
MSGGAIAAFATAARWLNKDMNPYRLTSIALLIGLIAFVMIIFADPMNSPLYF